MSGGGRDAGGVTGKRAAKPVTAVQDCVSTRRHACVHQNRYFKPKRDLFLTRIKCLMCLNSSLCRIEKMNQVLTHPRFSETNISDFYSAYSVEIRGHQPWFIKFQRRKHPLVYHVESVWVWTKWWIRKKSNAHFPGSVQSGVGAPWKDPEPNFMAICPTVISMFKPKCSEPRS